MPIVGRHNQVCPGCDLDSGGVTSLYCMFAVTNLGGTTAFCVPYFGGSW